MPIETAVSPNLIPYEVWESRERDKNRRPSDPEDKESEKLTPDEEARLNVIRYCVGLYDSSRAAREPHETFEQAWRLFNGDVWPSNMANWRARITINKIRAYITFMQAIMTDNKPRIAVEPVVAGSEEAADLLHRLVDRDWDENRMQHHLARWVLFGLIWGTGFMKITYDPFANGGRGKHLASVIPSYRIFTNRTATSIEDAEHIIQVDDMTMGWVRRNFPARAEAVKRAQGRRVDDHHERDRDYVNEGYMNERARIISAQSIDGNKAPPQYSRAQPEWAEDDSDTVEIMECWIRDDTLEEYQRQKVVNGQPQTEPIVLPDGSYDLQIVGSKLARSEIDGQPFMAPVRVPRTKPVLESAWRAKYPNGRLVIIAAGVVLLRDIPSPYQIDGFPYAMWKDFDVGAFWGQGEPLGMKDLALASMRIASQLYEILEKCGNPGWKMLKGAGVNAHSIKNKPGAIIPMDDLNAIAPMQKIEIPEQFFTLFKIINDAMNEVSGVNDAVRGGVQASNASFAVVDQLTESGAAPIRQKVRNLEDGLTRIGKLRIQLIQQFDNGSRPLRVPVDNDKKQNGVVRPASEVDVKFRKYTKADVSGPVEFSIVPISSLSTSPAGAWNRWMTMLDKHLVDRRWWHSKFRIEGWRTELPRMEKQETKDAEMEAAAKQASKPGPAPKKPASKAHRAQRPPPSQVPTPIDNAMVR